MVESWSDGVWVSGYGSPGALKSGPPEFDYCESDFGRPDAWKRPRKRKREEVKLPGGHAHFGLASPERQDNFNLVAVHF